MPASGSFEAENISQKGLMLYHRLCINSEAIKHIVLGVLSFTELWDKSNIWTSYFGARLFIAHDKYIRPGDFVFFFPSYSLLFHRVLIRKL